MEAGNSDSSKWPKFVGVGSMGLAAVVLVAWLATGAHIVTQYQVPVTVTETDEFGDKIERTVMKDQFRFGLLPDRGYDGAAPLILVFAAIGGGAFAYDRWQHRDET